MRPHYEGVLLCRTQLILLFSSVRVAVAIVVFLNSLLALSRGQGGQKYSNYIIKGDLWPNSWISNLELKHAGKLAIIGALLKAVKTSCVARVRLHVG